MVFSSLTFLFFFLPLALLIYYMSPGKGKNLVLLLVSLIFYAWGEPVYIVLMIFSACSDYLHGLLIVRYRLNERVKAKMILLSSILINVGVLSFFKYADFLIENINSVLGTDIALLQLPLPIGISFYTFQTMSYTIDVYRGQVQPQKNPIALAMYVSLFPQLIAGPIVRYKSIVDDLHNRKWDTAQFADGVRLFIIGLGKKVLLANNIGMLWSDISSQTPSEISMMTAWIGVIAFGFQIYFDFSGYSDMAIGLGKMFGFNFPRNFHYPFIAKSVTEFWRRWHISLGAWFRDYVFIPLGGSKHGKFATFRNLILVWGLTGLWHGASWNYALWGLYFGLIIVVEKAGLLRMLSKQHPFFQHLYLLFIISFSWVLFVFEELATATVYAKSMFWLSGNTLYDTQFLYYFYTNIILLLILIIAATPALSYVSSKTNQKRVRLITIIPAVYYTSILLVATAYLVDESYNPFLYFRF
ncbi:MBOAT family protein [Anaerobacillus sp. CMMVII]|uniref:MBOAT family O-acyltransferase n=1 Tax=Anaerobacillus sp. CMMVII TaxID=2755588 RepID=UPI0021B70228|nr:MBOAT family O-acyltransferase [Anaerobacillus sp. CMMVII]MCT8136713.1 MBOAT family protein [Anaerobacillus sp. CMMVII]